MRGFPFRFGCGLMLLAHPLLHAEEKPVPNFRLIDQDGISRELYRYRDRRAVVLIVQGNGCPIFRKSVREIRDLERRHSTKNVAFLLINANPQDTREAIRNEAMNYGILGLPILKDEAQLVAESLGLSRTAEALVIEPKGWRIAYRGAIDDRLNYGSEKPSVRHRYLEEALDAIEMGRRPAIDRTEVFGCLIALERRGTVSYENQAGPILAAKCLPCHFEPDGPAPMASYEQARGWSSMIRETLLTGRMPPWFADPKYGRFRDDPSLSTEELRTLVQWIDAGSPRGAGPDPLRNAKKPTPTTSLGQPDLLLEIEAGTLIAANGPSEYRYFQLAGPLQKDLWIRAVEIRPGNRRVLHHATLLDLSRPLARFPRDPSGHTKAIRHLFAGRGLWSWHPGRISDSLPEGVAIYVPKGHYLALEAHYGSTGKPEIDKSSVAIYFYTGANPPRPLKIVKWTDRGFEIPPGASDFRIGPSTALRFRNDAYLVNFRPHMHNRGTRMRAVAVFPDGHREPLLSVVNYDFNWQYVYSYLEPKQIPGGTSIMVDCAFDNSPSNPYNPDPNRSVTWGMDKNDEMALLAISYYDRLPSDAP